MLPFHEGVIFYTEFSILSKKQQKVSKCALVFIYEYRRTSSSVGAVDKLYLSDLTLLEVADQRKLWLDGGLSHCTRYLIVENGTRQRINNTEYA